MPIAVGISFLAYTPPTLVVDNAVDSRSVHINSVWLNIVGDSSPVRLDVARQISLAPRNTGDFLYTTTQRACRPALNFAGGNTVACAVEDYLSADTLGNACRVVD